MDKKPKYIYRKNDGFRFTLQSNGKYTMDKCSMIPKYEYDISVFKSNELFVFEKSLIDPNFTYKDKGYDRNDGHGNGDFDE